MCGMCVCVYVVCVHVCMCVVYVCVVCVCDPLCSSSTSWSSDGQDIMLSMCSSSM